MYVVKCNDRNKVVDAQKELSQLVEDEMRDTVVLAFVNTFTSSTALARGSNGLTGAMGTFGGVEMTSLLADTLGPSGGVAAKATLQRPFASRATGGYSLTSDDPARGSLTAFQSTRVARPQGCL